MKRNITEQEKGGEMSRDKSMNMLVVNKLYYK